MLILASASRIRAQLLRRSGLRIKTIPAQIDEAAIRGALAANNASPPDLASALAELKARKISDQHPKALVLGADQVLALGNRVFAKPETPAEAIAQLTALSGRTHKLLTALAICQGGNPIWRCLGEARLTMHPLPPREIEDYVAAHWRSIQHVVGCYKLEDRGARFFSRVEGDYFTVLGLPLIEFLNWLRARGELAR